MGAKLGIVALAAALLVVGGCEKASDAVFGARVRAYLLSHPEVLEEAVARLNDNRDAAAAQQAQAALAEKRDAIERDPRDFVANPNGKVTVTEFYDYNCTYCRHAAPDIVALIRDNPDVRFVFKEFPIFGGDSDRAAALALATKGSGNYLSIYETFFTAPSLTQPDMEQILTAKGLNVEALKQQAVSEPIVAHLKDTHDLAKALGISGTPTFVVGDQIIAGADMPALQQAIAAARRKA